MNTNLKRPKKVHKEFPEKHYYDRIGTNTLNSGTIHRYTVSTLKVWFSRLTSLKDGFPFPVGTAAPSDPLPAFKQAFFQCI
jgi:hypothetical protein